MEGKKPKTIFTDRCQAMANAIEKVFPETRHCLCLWHISKNAVQNLNWLYRNSDFGELFKKLLFGCVTEDEFESTWDEIIQKLDLAGNTWLQTLYNLREKWCALFSKDTFSVGILSTQRSESTNNVFTLMSTKTLSLTEFVHHYDKQAEQMRSSELEETFRCNNGIPTRAAKSSGIKKQAGMVYTRKIYNLFEFEFIASLAVKMEEVGSDGTLQTFELNEEGHKRVYIVQFNSSNLTISCSCQMYESMGWLCRHALRVLNVNNITQIPTQYILKRWTKDAKKGVEANSVPVQVKEKTTVTLRRNTLMRKAYGIISKGAETTSGSDIAMQKLIEAEELIEKNMKKLSIAGVLKVSYTNASASGANKNDTSFEETPVLNPAGKVKPPISGGPSHTSLHVVHNSSLSHPFVASNGTNTINEQFPTMSLPTTNVYAPYGLYNQNPTSMLPFSQVNLTYANMHQGGNYITQLNQDSYSSSYVQQSDRGKEV
ncbi:protein FAR1-RELATED SEQUENCE 5-like [Rosa chinensis]|uniref:protein FAR1-RELATED SEQUENCE 5-like n=1 Tax=Rosa chinensis TaxID=74649 RepID=UPI000D095753|nr:protein FAR1-RELATED SEQUENCE 5-like [Rosa chinensis]